jgi:Domain of unknown function (DUF4157)
MSSVAYARTSFTSDRQTLRRPIGSRAQSPQLHRQSLASSAIALTVSPRAASIQRACGCGGGGALEDPTMGRATMQPSLTVSSPGDPSELEADRVADEVMRMPASSAAPTSRISRLSNGPSLYRSCAACADADGDLSSVVARGIDGGGQALDAGTRAFMESRFGYDFSDVRVHTAGQAAESACSLEAQAYTVGSDIVFAAGRYAPETNSGRRLIAHELAHTVQQGVGSNGGANSGPVASLRRWPLSVMMLAAGCSGKSKKDCGGSCTHPTSGNPGTCRWSGTITYGCVCYENPSSKAVEVIVSALQAVLIAAGIVLAAAALVALIACIASGVCEVGAIIAAAGFAAAILIIGFLRSQGITVTDDRGSVASADTGGTAEESAVA